MLTTEEKGIVSMWNLAKNKSLRDSINLDDIKYSNLTLNDRLEILRITTGESLDVYYQESEREVTAICLYNKEYEEFITENGFKECNLEVFWNECIEELVSNYNMNIACNPAS